MVVLDTNFIIDHLNKNEQAVAFFWKLAERQERLATTVINIYELQVGLRKSPRKEKNQNAINDIRRIAKILGVDIGTVDIATKIYNDLAEKGQVIDDFDIFIAAVCIVNNETLVTKNVKHFERIKGLKIETY